MSQLKLKTWNFVFPNDFDELSEIGSLDRILIFGFISEKSFMKRLERNQLYHIHAVMDWSEQKERIYSKVLEWLVFGMWYGRVGG